MKIMFKAARLFFVLIPLFLGNLFAGSTSEQQVPPVLNAIVWEQAQIIAEGRRLAAKGVYEAAISKYSEALAPRFIFNESRKSGALWETMRVYRLQGKYDESLKGLQWFIDNNRNSKVKPWLDDKLELEALIKARELKSPQPIYDHIQYLRKKYINELPPKAGGYSSIIASMLIYLYDHIGDSDAGIELMDGFIRYYAKKAHIKPEQVGSKNQYLQIKRAFEQDKKEGFKGCLDAKPGDACMGRATKALIQSDYFPW
jgi:tetratricopeptide (TPR) repeat protein